MQKCNRKKVGSVGVKKEKINKKQAPESLSPSGALAESEFKLVIQ